MKKLIKTFFLIFVVALVLLIVWIVIKPTDRIQAIYLVPDDAAVVVSSKDPFRSWEELSGSDIWKGLQEYPDIVSFTYQMNALDSTVARRRLIFKLLGSREVMVSYHPGNTGMDNVLFIADMKRLTHFRSLHRLVQRLSGENLDITSRDYHGNEILEFRASGKGKLISTSVHENLLLITTNHRLIESAIDQMGEPIIGRDPNYVSVREQMSGDHMIQVFLNHSVLNADMSEVLSGKNDLVYRIFSGMEYTGISIDIDGGNRLQLNCFISLTDTTESNLLPVLDITGKELSASGVIPGSAGLFLDTYITDMNYLFEQASKDMPEDILKTRDRLEKRFKIDIKRDFFSWMSGEIGFFQNQASGMGAENEYALLVQANRISNAKEKLAFIQTQVKRNAPVKFKHVDYKDHEIHYLSLTGIVKVLFGRLFQKMDRPYYTFIEDYVVFSNHPQTIKNLITAYIENQMLSLDPEFKDLRKEFNRKSGMFMYIHTARFFQNLQPYLSNESWVKLQKKREPILRFSTMGLQAGRKGEILQAHMVIDYREHEVMGDVSSGGIMETVEGELFLGPEDFIDIAIDSVASEERDLLPQAEIYPDDLTAREYVEYYENGNIRIKSGMKDGIRDGDYKEYYDNGQVRMTGRYRAGEMHGTWRFYDEFGNLLERRRYEDGVEK